MLSHEKLDVYQKSIDFVSLALLVINSLPKGYSSLADQLKRASMSVPLNIAEASGRTGSADNARHFSIARGSALECGAVLDICQRLGIIEESCFSSGKQLLMAIIAMLSALCNKK